MDRYPQPSNSHGSLNDIQILVNRFPDLFHQAIKKELDIKSDVIDWVSPLESDDFSEYRDMGFIEKLGIGNLKTPLNDFWPKRGPQWDALGSGQHGEVFLIEAKANISELISPETKAGGKSLELISGSLNETKQYFGVNNSVHWTGKYYQYTNRLAHLYFLRVLNNIPAHLIFVYFLGDASVNGPKTVAEWQAAITIMKKHLGPGSNNMSQYIGEVLIDCKGEFYENTSYRPRKLTSWKPAAPPKSLS